MQHGQLSPLLAVRRFGLDRCRRLLDLFRQLPGRFISLDRSREGPRTIFDVVRLAACQLECSFALSNSLASFSHST